MQDERNTKSQRVKVEKMNSFSFIERGGDLIGINLFVFLKCRLPSSYAKYSITVRVNKEKANVCNCFLVAV